MHLFLMDLMYFNNGWAFRYFDFCTIYSKFYHESIQYINCEMPIHLHFHFNPSIFQQTELSHIFLQLKLTWFNNIVGTNEIFGLRVAVASPWWLSSTLPSLLLAHASIGSQGTLNFCEHCKRSMCHNSGNKENKWCKCRFVC